jgi:hypothetical protein
MKTALLLSGRAEHFDKTVDLFIENVIKPTDCDIYIHTELNDDFYKMCEILKAKEIVPKAIEATLYEELFVPDRFKTLRDVRRDDYQQRYVQQLIHLLKCFDLCDRREGNGDEEQFIYNLYIRSRFDLLIETKIDFIDSLEEDIIYIPGIDHKNKCCDDRFAIGSRNPMYYYCTRYINHKSEYILRLAEHECYEALADSKLKRDKIKMQEIEVKHKRVNEAT